ncbi:hypothetical protein KSP40_PGU004094 [Platanthera guangdongensis]|uniref:Uncharacterized protein n=1 Tax=Platanthera guangdongensis TaxID=2320717 RepID=A0ABR2M0X1_9ASPA
MWQAATCQLAVKQSFGYADFVKRPPVEQQEKLFQTFFLKKMRRKLRFVFKSHEVYELKKSLECQTLLLEEKKKHIRYLKQKFTERLGIMINPSQSQEVWGMSHEENLPTLYYLSEQSSPSYHQRQKSYPNCTTNSELMLKSSRNVTVRMRIDYGRLHAIFPWDTKTLGLLQGLQLKSGFVLEAQQQAPKPKCLKNTEAMWWWPLTNTIHHLLLENHRPVCVRKRHPCSSFDRRLEELWSMRSSTCAASFLEGLWPLRPRRFEAITGL